MTTDGGDRDAPTAILISGWAHPARVLCPLAHALAPDFETNLLDTCDLGDDPGQWSGRLAERIAGTARPPVVIGWSLGGMIALEALTSGSSPPVSAWVLIASTPRFCAGPDWPWGQTRAALRALQIGVRRDPQAALRSFLAECSIPSQVSPAELDRQVSSALAQGDRHLAAGLDYLAGTDLTARIPHLRVPLLCIHGESDRIIPVEASRNLAQACAGRLEVLPNCGHSVVVTAADRVASAIRRGVDTT